MALYLLKTMITLTLLNVRQCVMANQANDGFRRFWGSGEKKDRKPARIFPEVFTMKTNDERPRILVVDDDEQVCDSLSLYLDSWGARVSTAQTADAGIAAMKGGYYDVIMVDCDIPGGKGFDLFRRAKRACPSARGIMIFAYGNTSVSSQALEMGIEETLEKPFNGKTLDMALNRVLRDHRNGRKGGAS